MKFKLLLSGAVLVCSSLLVVNGVSAQGCKVELTGPGGIIIDSFHGEKCKVISKRCNKKLRRLQNQDSFYRDAYCDVSDGDRNSAPVVTPAPVVTSPPPPVIRSYDRCQAPGIVRCTQEWSNGQAVTEDYPCSGCKGYGNPAGDPCGWQCSFPQQ